MQRKIWNILTSVRLAVVLIGVIAVLCTVATLLPQGQEAAFYTENYGTLLGVVIQALAFDKMYSSGLFILSGVIFGVNLCCCTWLRFRWAVSRSKPRFRLYAWGSPVLHVGLCVVLVGVGVSLLLGRESYHEAMIGDVVEVYEGSQPFTARIDDVVIDYYPDSNVPMQYTTQMTLTAKDGTVAQDAAEVNRRVKFSGSAIMQSHYGWASRLRITQGEQTQELRLKDETWQLLSQTDRGDWKIAADFMADYAEDPERGPYSKSERPNNPRLVFMVALNDEPLDFAVLAEGESGVLADEILVTFLGYENFTGLHMKYDPGVPLIFAGFVLTCIGLVVRFSPFGKEKIDGLG